MAMLTYCFFCKKSLIIPSADEAHEITDYDIKEVEELSNYIKEHPYGLIGKYCCEDCFRTKILPHLFK